MDSVGIHVYTYISYILYSYMLWVKVVICFRLHGIYTLQEFLSVLMFQNFKDFKGQIGGQFELVTRACYQTSCNLARSKSLAIPPSLLKNPFPVQRLQNREPKDKLKKRLETDITKAHFSDCKTKPCFELVLNLG